MIGYQLIQRASLFLTIAISALVVSSTPPADIARREDFIPGPYALRLVTTNPSLTNAFYTRDLYFQENPDPAAIQPVWAGRSYWQFLHPNATDNLYDWGGSIFMDERRNITDSLQLKLEYAKVNGQRWAPYLDLGIDRGLGVTHGWPENVIVAWGAFRFVKQADSGKTFLFDGDGTDPRWRWATLYLRSSGEWQVVYWNGTDPSVPLPEKGEFINIEVIPFEQVGGTT